MREKILHRDRRKIDSYEIFIETGEFSECFVFVSFHMSLGIPALYMISPYYSSPKYPVDIL